MAKDDNFDEYDDFETFEDIEDESENTSDDDSKEYTGKKRIITMVIIVIVSLLLGFTVYKVCDVILNNQKPPENEKFMGESIPLDDENVKVLYQYVTYGLTGNRTDKFVKDKEVTMASFSDDEKFDYALQFAEVDDFEFTGELNDKKQKIYTISNDTIYKYMRLFFGPSVKYQPVQKKTYLFTFLINRMNVGTLTYNNERNGYDVVFGSFQEPPKPDLIPPVYGQLISALRRPDGSIILQERIVYPELRTDNGGYALNIYKEAERKTLLDTITGLNDDNIGAVQIDLQKYQSTAIVEYLFGVNDMTCYFSSSRIID